MITIEDFIIRIKDTDLATNLKAMNEKFLPLMKSMPAACRHHHATVGGYYDHVQDVMNIAFNIWTALQAQDTVSLDDLILVTYLHDLSKILGQYKRNDGSYAYKENGQWVNPPFMYNSDFKSLEDTGLIATVVSNFGIKLSIDHLHALSYAHGGWSAMSHTTTDHGMTVLAIILHSADMLSVAMYKERMKKGN